MNERIDKIIDIVLQEYNSATEKFGPFNSTHEGYAVILEELDEAWDAIKNNRPDHAAKEMKQVAAMALRWLHDCSYIDIDEENDHEVDK